MGTFDVWASLNLARVGMLLVVGRGGGARGGAEGALAPHSEEWGGGLSPTTFSEASGEKNSSLWRPWTPASVQSFNGRVSPPTFFFVPPPLVVGSSRFHSLAHVLYREFATMLFLASQNFSWEAVPALVLVVFIIYCSLQDLL